MNDETFKLFNVTTREAEANLPIKTVDRKELLKSSRYWIYEVATVSRGVT